MLFELTDDLSGLKPLPFLDFTHYKKPEKHLEKLLSTHLFDVLFEGTSLLPFHQERPYQPEGDIYAVDARGDLFIFELKVAIAGDTALGQLFRYAQDAGRWSYDQMDKKFRAYAKGADGGQSLADAHKEGFCLPTSLIPDQFNRSQHLYVVGSAANEELVRVVEFWKRKGLSIDFFPYRIFEISGKPYFEFFAKPYDAHRNPGTVKGLLFDTCRTYIPDALKWMIENRRVSAYGDRKDAVYSLTKGDTVFYSHRGVGLVAAAKITGNSVRKGASDDELYWEVDFLTPTPTNFQSPPAMPFPRVKEVTGQNFFWARILKVPYLSAVETEHLLNELRTCLGGSPEAVRNA